VQQLNEKKEMSETRDGWVVQRVRSRELISKRHASARRQGCAIEKANLEDSGDDFINVLQAGERERGLDGEETKLVRVHVQTGRDRTNLRKQKQIW
jgi:hypothetical protein